MTRYFSTKKLIGFSIFTTVLLFAFSGSHPTTGSGGYTGAPNDNVCTTCHTPGGSLDGTIEIGGLPSAVTENTTYPLTITITNTAGSADRAGFQMVSLKASLANGGTFSVPASEPNALVKTASGKSYIGHQPAKDFTGGVATYNVDWTAPASATGDITVYAAAIIANGGNGNQQDKFVTTNMAVTLDSGGDPLTGTFSNIVDASCSDTNDGSATITAMGGSGSYMYNWDNGETGSIAIMLSAGTHTVTVTDDSTGEIIESVTIGAPAELVPAIIFQTDATCNGTLTGTAELTAAGGTPGYNFNWGSGITGPIQTNLGADNYAVTVSDINGCSSVINVIIGEPTAIQINIIDLQEPACNGDSNGKITVEATGGSGGFTYNWLDGIGIPSGGMLSSIPAGEYQVEVIDAQACINETTITLGEPDAVTSSITSSNILCFGGNDGTATADGQGGNGGFSYAWSNGGSEANQTGLIAGTYEVTVSDSDDCTSVSSVEITQPSTSVEAGISILSQPNCGNEDGELSAFATGGTPGYNYLWNDNSTSAVLTNISSGLYTVTITDMNNCASVSMVTLEDNDGVSLAANDVQNNNCFGDSDGSATVSASGGTGIYTFEWSNGGTNATENNLPAGAYTITVSDESNCTGEISIEITEPAEIEANETLVNITCNGAENGSIQLNATGGTGELTYAWNTGDVGDAIINLIPGIFRVTITDQNNCTSEIEFVISEPDAIATGDVVSTTPSCPEAMDGSIALSPSGGTGALSLLWSTGETTSTVSNLSAGDYSVTITDENDCEMAFDFTLDDPTALSISSSSTSPTCSDGNDGSATLSLMGGSGSYDIEWSTGGTTISITDLPAGIYTVTVTDDNGCSNEAEVTVVAPLPIDPNISSTNETSNGASDGTATSDPQNGLAPYTYLWGNGETTQSIDGLAPGTYGVTITDSNGCMVTAIAIINSGDCNISSMVDLSNMTCFGLLDGSISVELEGAVEPIVYSWSNGETSAGLTNLGSGGYSVTITDANNCQIQITDIEITEPDDIVASDPIISDATSSTVADGSIEIDFTGGTGEYTIDFTDGDGNDIGLTSFDELAAGSYGVFVTDENDCMKFFGPYLVGVISSLDDLNSIVANIFPNPAQSFFVIETESELSSNPSVYTVSGQLIETTFAKGLNRYTFDSSRLANGVYYIKLSSERNVILKKVIITK